MPDTAKRVAAFLRELNDELVNEEFTNTADRREILGRSAPIVLELAVKGYFK